MKNKLKQLSKIEKELYDHVDFEEGWSVFPIEDCTDYYWKLDDCNVTF